MEVDDDDRSLLHIEMAGFARLTCRAIDNGDERSMCAHFDFIEAVLSKAAPDVENAIYVSYLENIFLGEQPPAILRARAALPARLSVALSELERHFRLLNANAAIIEYIRENATSAQVRGALTAALEGLLGVEVFWPGSEKSKYLTARIEGLIFGAATRQDTVAFRLDSDSKMAAIRAGAEEASQIGPEWVTFRVFQDDQANLDLKFWASKACTFARETRV
jgi:hypothetical protein